MSGRCTLTATRRPSRSAARCTWPSDAAAIGVSSNDRECLRQSRAELLFDDSSDVGERERLDAVLQPRQRFEVGRRQQIRPRRQHLAELDERRPEFLEVVGQCLGRLVRHRRRRRSHRRSARTSATATRRRRSARASQEDCHNRGRCNRHSHLHAGSLSRFGAAARLCFADPVALRTSKRLTLPNCGKSLPS